MKWLTWICRFVLAGMFLFFGSNLIVGFTGSPHPSGLAGDFRNAMAATSYLKIVGALQVLGGSLMLADATVPLGLVVLGPIIVNIALYHLCFKVAGFPLVALCLGDELALLWIYRSSFNGMIRKSSAS